jgi:hypothetical protein
MCLVQPFVTVQSIGVNEDSDAKVVFYTSHLVEILPSHFALLVDVSVFHFTQLVENPDNLLDRR